MTWRSEIKRRLWVAAAAWSVGASAAVVASLWLASYGRSWSLAPAGWCLVMLGPLSALVDAPVAAALGPLVHLGFAGLVLIPVHPIFPTRVGAFCTVAGFSLWFFSGGAALFALLRPA